MGDPNYSNAIIGIIHIILSGIVTLILGLCFWILNNISKRVSKIEKTIEEAIEKINNKINALQEDRTEKWLAKEKDCRDEDKRLARLEERVRIEERRDKKD